MHTGTRSTSAPCMAADDVLRACCTEACVHLRALHRQPRRRRRRRRRRWRREGAGEGGAHDAVAGEGGADEGGAGEGGAGEDGSDERDAGEGGADERGAGERGAGMGDDGIEHDDDHCKHGDSVSVKRARAGSVTQAEHSCAWRVLSARHTHL